MINWRRYIELNYPCLHVYIITAWHENFDLHYKDIQDSIQDIVNNVRGVSAANLLSDIRRAIVDKQIQNLFQDENESTRFAMSYGKRKFLKGDLENMRSILECIEKNSAS